MKSNTKQICLYIDNKTKALLDGFANRHAISRSSTVRLILRDFFEKRELNDIKAKS